MLLYLEEDLHIIMSFGNIKEEHCGKDVKCYADFTSEKILQTLKGSHWNDWVKFQPNNDIGAHDIMLEHGDITGFCSATKVDTQFI